MGSAIRSEILKLGRRRMASVYLAMLFLLSGVANVLISVFTKSLHMGQLPSLPDRARAAFLIVSTVGVLLALVFGASASGWEFKNRTLPGLLTREPQRGVVWAAKLIALAILCTAFALVTAIGGTLGIAVAAGIHGVAAEPRWFREAARLWVEALGQSAGIFFAASVFGAALGMLLRSTGGAIAVGLGFLFVVDNVIALVLNHYWKGAGDYLFGSVLDNFGTHLPFSSGHFAYAFGTAAFVLALWTAGLALVGYLPLERRDVT